jgi:hypothetical protein
MAEQNGISYVLSQRCVIEFCAKLGKSGEETLQILENAYGTEVISRPSVFQWWKHLKAETKRLVEGA